MRGGKYDLYMTEAIRNLRGKGIKEPLYLNYSHILIFLFSLQSKSQ